MNAKVECQRGNITLAAFLSYVKRQSDKAGLCCDIDQKEFENPQYTSNSNYVVKDGKIIFYNDGIRNEMSAEYASCESEVNRIKPLDFQTYVKNFDGSSFNEICEFTFDTETTGHGYYWQENIDAVEVQNV